MPCLIYTKHFGRNGTKAEDELFFEKTNISQKETQAQVKRMAEKNWKTLGYGKNVSDGSNKMPIDRKANGILPWTIIIIF